jgi:hypothetical protein
MGVDGSDDLMGFSTVRDRLYRALRRDVPLGPVASAHDGAEDYEDHDEEEWYDESSEDEDAELMDDTNVGVIHASLEAASGAERAESSTASGGGVVVSEGRGTVEVGGFTAEERVVFAASNAALRSLSMHPVVSVSGRGGGLGFHRHDASWLALLSGLKLWCFMPPTKPPRSAHQRCSAEALLCDPNVTVCVQRPGDLVVVPRGWWHATYNLSTDHAGGCEHDDTAKCVAVGFGGLASSPGLHWQAAEGDVEALEAAWNQMNAAAAARTRPVNFPNPGQRQAAMSGSSSRFKGVSWNSQKNKWRARASNKHLGYFDNEEEAARRFDAAFGSAVNFPEEIGLTPVVKSRSSRFVGVYPSTIHEAWISQIEINGKTTHLGSYDDEEMAARKFDEFVTSRVNPPIVDPLSLKTHTGKTLMHTAAYYGHLAVCQWLGKQAAAQARRDALAAPGGNSGVPPEVGAVEAAAQFAVGALATAPCVLRTTPLHWAAAQGHADTCVWLMERGAHPRLSSGLGETPVSLAKLAADFSPPHRRTLSALASHHLL